jgi:hypothetical protein
MAHILDVIVKFLALYLYSMQIEPG